MWFDLIFLTDRANLKTTSNKVSYNNKTQYEDCEENTHDKYNFYSGFIYKSDLLKVPILPDVSVFIPDFLNTWLLFYTFYTLLYLMNYLWQILFLQSYQNHLDDVEYFKCYRPNSLRLS
jgi:hypothetical protein